MDFTDKLYKAVEEFASHDEAFGDAPQLRIDPRTKYLEIIEDPDENLPEYDYYDLADLIQMKPDGSWIPDPDALAEIAGEY